MKIFLDMDEVFCDFVKAWRLHTPEVDEFDIKLFKKVVKEHKLFENLEFIEESKQFKAFFDSIQVMYPHVEIQMLSAAGSPDHLTEVTLQKQIWLLRHGFDFELNVVAHARDKVLFCKGDDHILIDDRLDTIGAWIDAGGTGHHYDPEYKHASQKRIATDIMVRLGE